jgi:hypothetical protein
MASLWIGLQGCNRQTNYLRRLATMPIKTKMAIPVKIMAVWVFGFIGVQLNVNNE